MYKTTLTLIPALFFIFLNTNAQNIEDEKEAKWSLHAQATTVSQYAFKFKSPYAGENSLQNNEPIRTSFTSTIFAAYKVSSRLNFVFNPEMSAGKGLSQTTGIAGFPNGEVYRVGDPNPQFFIARLYATYKIPLSKEKVWQEDDINQIKSKTYKNYFSITAGKFALTDFFDDSEISHDPRTQFMNWSLMGNGAWDYPANVRGYTLGVVMQFVLNDWGIRVASTSVPTEANGPNMQWKGAQASGNVLEIEKTHLFKKNEKQFTTFHAGVFLNKANMGNYATSTKTGLVNFFAPDITDSRQYGRSKTGFYVSFDNHFNKVHHFIKGSWNDGENETWAFTEIDRSIATGFSFEGSNWKRNKDHLGIAFVANGISKPHREYLADGGYGFIIGDSKLNYAAEKTISIYYSLHLKNKIFLSPDYQLVTNPAYNKDRGPVHLFAIRLHADF